jgi:general secretion pathway protein B
MSYILDALKRADAERGQDRAPLSMLEPGAVSGDLGKSPPRPVHRDPRAWAVLIGVVVLVAAAALAWQRWGRSTPAADPVALATAPAHAVISSAPTPPPSPLPAATLVPEPLETPAPAPVLPIHGKAPPVPPPPPPRLPEVSPKSPAPDALASTAAAPPQSTPVPALPSTPTALPALSAAARAALPEIQVSGSSYSANREHRMLIANGQVVKEGQELSPGLTLEVIGPRSAVFNHNGTRFNINY